MKLGGTFKAYSCEKWFSNDNRLLIPLGTPLQRESLI
jgi:hypothetical protein